MKSFLEEYGIVIVVAVVIFGLIGTSIFFRDTGGDSLKGFLNNFQSKAEIFEETSTAEVKTATYAAMGQSMSIQYEEGMTWQEWLDSSYGSGYIRKGLLIQPAGGSGGIHVPNVNSVITGEEALMA